MTMDAKLGALVARSEEIDELLASPEIASNPDQLTKLAKERAEIQPVVAAFQELRATRRSIEDARVLIDDSDPEMADLAKQEKTFLDFRLGELEAELKSLLIPRDPNDDKNVIMEIRAGTGGEEAALFAFDLYRMYQRYAQRHAFSVDLVDISESEQGGLKEVVFQVQGSNAFRFLKHESGVHRVQRVPSTETQGRIHTSTATVAVLPEAEEVDLIIKPEELRTDIYHAGGPGGQNVNKVATAVRLVHIPTGIMVVSQDERSQLKNKNKAMAVMRSRLLEREIREQQQQTSAARRSQVGSGERSEKIRTYNFPQDRLTDHRVGITVHGLDDILSGRQDSLDQLVAALLNDEQAQMLAEESA